MSPQLAAEAGMLYARLRREGRVNHIVDSVNDVPLTAVLRRLARADFLRIETKIDDHYANLRLRRLTGRPFERQFKLVDPATRKMVKPDASAITS